MSLKTYNYIVSGRAAEDQSWTTTGTVRCEFHTLFNNVMQSSFRQMTGGKAIYGKPGIGCRGPYDIRKVEITQVKPGERIPNGVHSQHQG